MRAFRTQSVPFENKDMITIPDQAFTPRQILEQFARNEVVPSMYSPSDIIDDEHYTEDQLINDVIEFEDDIDAENHLIENQYVLQSETNKSESSSDKSSERASEKASDSSGEGNSE